MKKYMSLFLATVVFLTSIFAGSASAYAATLNGSYILKASGSPTAVINGKVYAALLPEPPAEKWVITPVPASGEDVVTIQTSDRSKAWTVSSSDGLGGSLIAVDPLISGSPAPNQLFRIVSPESDHPNAIQLLTKISGQPVGRFYIEDRSLLPKAVYSISQSKETPLWIAQPTK